jgi:hypothetical protein
LDQYDARLMGQLDASRSGGDAALHALHTSTASGS